MKELIEKADILIEALPYMREFSNKTVVIKYGGNAMVNKDLMASVLEDVTLLKYVGVNPVIVHGGGPVISNNLEQYELETDFHKGFRITSQEVMQVVEKALIGEVNTNLVSLANSLGIKAVGLSGKDNQMILAQKCEMDCEVELGYVGEVDEVDPTLLNSMIDSNYVPIVAPVGTDKEGNSYNINADLVAGEIAAALEAEKLMLLTNTEGILEDPEDKSTLISRLKIAEAKQKIEDEIIVGGMIPKVNACITALEKDVNRTHILDGRLDHSILLEIFTDKGIGTMITK
ncbi:acetylglutamate kinase [Halanaerobacter jeridensis]|uniref:Acetylglutamate kinase n=1 Tax=Halanaerobacter jeridensis TaxID=706427 RepID=A0A938XQR1_9FIRM|nr:acetylglutamate kinase [Halanaerobacter jeridensis]MBM7558193.1 acetylglutamate kinase [Halanaerobacter jeridensis]